MKKAIKKLRPKYAEGGVVEESLSTLDSMGDPVKPKQPMGPITEEQWGVLKQKYAGDLPLVKPFGASAKGSPLDKRMKWISWANQDLPTSGTPAALSAKAAKQAGIDPGMLLASSLEEGVGLRFMGQGADYSNAYALANEKGELKGFPVDGFRNYGLDQISGRVDEFIKKGWLPSDFKSRMKTFYASNELDEKEYYQKAAKAIQGYDGLLPKDFKFAANANTYNQLDKILDEYEIEGLPEMKRSAATAAFKDDEAAYLAKAAFLRSEQENVGAYAKQRGYKLTPEEQQFFTMASYNGGLGNARQMLDYYGGRKELGNNAFLKSRANKGQIYDNILPRFAGSRLFTGEGYFKYGGKMPKAPKGVPKYNNGGVFDPIKPKRPGTILPSGDISYGNARISSAPPLPDSGRVDEGFPMPTEDGTGVILPNGETVYGNGRVGMAPPMPSITAIDEGFAMPFTTKNGEEGTIYPNGVISRISTPPPVPITSAVDEGFAMPIIANTKLRGVREFNKGGKIPKYQDGTEDPIKGITPANFSNNSKVNPWDIANGQAPINPRAEQSIALNQSQGTPTNQESIVPLSQFYETINLGNGQTGLQGTGSYVNNEGQTTSVREQQAQANQISDQNRITAENREGRMDTAETISSTAMSAINAFFNKTQAAQSNRTNKRKALMDTIDSQLLNPYLEGTGSQAIFEKGGKMEGNTLGINILDGGKAKLISDSDHSNGMVEFTGKEHKKGGIGLEYGGNIAEVENKEVGWVDNEGGLNIFGKLKLPGTNQTFKKAAKDIAEQESKVDRKKTMYTNTLTNADNADPYQQSAISTAKVMFKSLDRQSKQIAEKKEALASYQDLILNMANASSNNMAYGGKMPRKPYAEGGEIGPDDPIQIIPLKKDFKKGDRDLRNIKGIVLHKTAGTSSAKDVIAGWDSDNREASADYIIDKDGSITQVGELGDTKWHSGRKNINKTTFGIELVGASSDESDVTPEQYRALKRLHNEVFAPMGLTANNYYGHTQVNRKKGFDFANPNSIKNVLTQSGISNTYDPDKSLFDPLYSGQPSALAQAEDAQAIQNQSMTYTSQNSGMAGYNAGPNLGASMDTQYGPARRQPTAFSDKATVSNAQKERAFLSPLAIEQIAPELLTIATNRREGFPQLSYQPDLKQTFDISYQLGRNENQATFNQVARMAEQTGNIDALSQLAAQKYKADQAYNMQEVQGNAQQRLQTYNQNVDTLNDAQMKNLAFVADQQVKQAQAKFNTRAEDLAAFRSISGKVLQNELENKTYNAYANLFKHYGFDKRGNVTFNPDNIVKKFTAGEAQQFGMMAARQGASSLTDAIQSGDFSRQFTKVKNNDGSQTTTETLGTNKKIQEEYKALKNQGFDDSLIGNMLRAKYPETITQ